MTVDLTFLYNLSSEAQKLFLREMHKQFRAETVFDRSRLDLRSCISCRFAWEKPVSEGVKKGISQVSMLSHGELVKWRAVY
jgi:hypothetical protein